MALTLEVVPTTNLLLTWGVPLPVGHALVTLGLAIGTIAALAVLTTVLAVVHRRPAARPRAFPKLHALQGRTRAVTPCASPVTARV